MGDACGGGSCQPGSALVCNDNNVCTTDTCNPTTGCVFTNNTIACDDGNACTQLDTCSGGACVPGPAANCDDGNACTADTCDTTTGCVHGDVNLDVNVFSSDRVDGRDLVVLADAWNSCPGDTAYNAAANLDQAGCVDLIDFHFFMMSFGLSCP
jgi:hypothetical protein